MRYNTFNDVNPQQSQPVTLKLGKDGLPVSSLTAHAYLPPFLEAQGHRCALNFINSHFSKENIPVIDFHFKTHPGFAYKSPESQKNSDLIHSNPHHTLAQFRAIYEAQNLVTYISQPLAMQTHLIVDVGSCKRMLMNGMASVMIMPNVGLQDGARSNARMEIDLAIQTARYQGIRKNTKVEKTFSDFLDSDFDRYVMANLKSPYIGNTPGFSGFMFNFTDSAYYLTAQDWNTLATTCLRLENSVAKNDIPYQFTQPYYTIGTGTMHVFRPLQKKICNEISYLSLTR